MPLAASLLLHCIAVGVPSGVPLPAQDRASNRAPGTATGEWLDAGDTWPLETRRSPGGHLLVPVFLDEREAVFILDSGASATVFDPQLSEELALPTTGSVMAQSAAGTQRTTLRTCPRLEVGPLVFQDLTIAEADLSMLAEPLGTAVDGILGRDVFQSAVVEIPPAPAPVVLHEREAYELPEGAQWQELDFTSGLPALRARFEGDHEGLFRIDSGASGGVMFHAPAVKRFGLLENRETERAESEEIGGTVVVHMGKLTWFELGGRRFEDLSVGLVVDAGGGALGDDAVTGNIGHEVLGKFTLVFDFAGRRIALLPVPAQEPEQVQDEADAPSPTALLERMRAVDQQLLQAFTLVATGTEDADPINWKEGGQVRWRMAVTADGARFAIDKTEPEYLRLHPGTDQEYGLHGTWSFDHEGNVRWTRNVRDSFLYTPQVYRELVYGMVQTCSPDGDLIRQEPFSEPYSRQEWLHRPYEESLAASHAWAYLLATGRFATLFFERIEEVKRQGELLHVTATNRLDKTVTLLVEPASGDLVREYRSDTRRLETSGRLETGGPVVAAEAKLHYRRGPATFGPAILAVEAFEVISMTAHFDDELLKHLETEW